MPRVDGETLRAWRRSRGWDVPKMARELRRAAREAGQAVASPTGLIQMIYAWERCAHQLTERYELLYAAAFGVDAERLCDGPAPPADGSDVAQLPAPSLNLGITDAMLTAVGAEEGDVDRRAFNIAAIGLLAGTLAPPGPAPATASTAETRRLRLVASDLWARDWTMGGNALLRDAIGHYASARGILDHSSYTAAVGRELQVLTADLAACAGFVAFDAGMQPLARSLLSESTLLAGSTGDPVLIAHAYALLALQSTSLATLSGRKGPAREALRFLDQAGDVARHEPSPRLHATICMRRATASALLEDDVEARKNIAGARRELDRGDHPGDPDWAGFVTMSEITAHEAMAALSQGKPHRAARLFRDVLDDPSLPARYQALYQARLAVTLHAAGDKAEAVSEGLRVLAVLEGPVKSARTLHQIRPVRQDAEPGSEFAVRFDAMAS